MYNMKRLYILLAAGTIAAAASAQTTSIPSRVKAVSGQPVSGAIVTVVGEKNSVVTDETGAFALQTDDRDALVSIKAEGFYDRTIPLRLLQRKNGQSDYQIMLTPQQEALYDGKAETAYGTQSRDERSATIGGVETKDFTQKLSVGAATRDAIAGLQVIEKCGMPGEGTYMNLRGIHSFVADNSPLIVINGIPYMGNNEVSGIINGYSYVTLSIGSWLDMVNEYLNPFEELVTWDRVDVVYSTPSGYACTRILQDPDYYQLTADTAADGDGGGEDPQPTAGPEEPTPTPDGDGGYEADVEIEP